MTSDDLLTPATPGRRALAEILTAIQTGQWDPTAQEAELAGQLLTALRLPADRPYPPYLSLPAWERLTRLASTGAILQLTLTGKHRGVGRQFKQLLQAPAAACAWASEALAELNLPQADHPDRRPLSQHPDFPAYLEDAEWAASDLTTLLTVIYTGDHEY